MKCIFHKWSWPRKRGDLDVQICSKCASERPSPIQFRKAQPEPVPEAQSRSVVNLNNLRDVRTRQAPAGGSFWDRV